MTDSREPAGIGELALALIKAQQAFDPIKRDAEAQIGSRRFRYATLDAIYTACKPALLVNGLVLTHRVKEDRLISTVLHTSGERMHSAIYIGKADGWQDYGKALTYATRYNTRCLLGVVDEDDTDAEGLGGRPKADPVKKMRVKADLCVTPAQLSGLSAASANASPDEKRAIMASAKSRGWKFTDGHFVAPDTDAGSGPPF